MDVYVEMNLNLRRATKDLDAHELSVRKVDVVAQVLRTIQQVIDYCDTFVIHLPQCNN